MNEMKTTYDVESWAGCVNSHESLCCARVASLVMDHVHGIMTDTDTEKRTLPVRPQQIVFGDLFFRNYLLLNRKMEIHPSPFRQPTSRGLRDGYGAIVRKVRPLKEALMPGSRVSVGTGGVSPLAGPKDASPEIGRCGEYLSNVCD